MALHLHLKRQLHADIDELSARAGMRARARVRGNHDCSKLTMIILCIVRTFGFLVYIHACGCCLIVIRCTFR